MHGSVLLLLLGLKGNRQKIKNGPGSKVGKNIYSDNLQICLGKLVRYKVLTPKVSKSSSWYRLGGIPKCNVPDLFFFILSFQQFGRS